jgi:hypothetical protein
LAGVVAITRDHDALIFKGLLVPYLESYTFGWFLSTAGVDLPIMIDKALIEEVFDFVKIKLFFVPNNF